MIKGEDNCETIMRGDQFIILGFVRHGGEYEGSPPSGSDAERSGRGRPR